MRNPRNVDDAIQAGDVDLRRPKVINAETSRAVKFNALVEHHHAQ